ncbi:MAG: MarR family transcriptional regulator [Pseudomonadota bacterium]
MGSDLTAQAASSGHASEPTGKTDRAAAPIQSLTEDYRPIFQEIARFRSIIFDAKLSSYDITMSQGWVLVHLWRENGLRQSDLAERLDIATVTTSKLIDRLESGGFVERRDDPADRRSKRVFATSEGLNLVKVMTSIVYEVDEIANSGISKSELARTMTVLMKMRDNLRDRNGRK